MELLDIHTHCTPHTPGEAIQNVLWKDKLLPTTAGYYSVGIHPYYLTEVELAEQEAWLLATIDSAATVIAIGEAGLDKTIRVSWELQLSAFEFQIACADRVGLPLLLHVVRAHQEVMVLKRRFQPRNQWIVHGFRGKRELAAQYLHEGFSLSFGEHYNEEALRQMPLDKLFLETDDSGTDIHQLYEKASVLLGVPIQTLIYQVQQNIKNTFFTP